MLLGVEQGLDAGAQDIIVAASNLQIGGSLGTGRLLYGGRYLEMDYNGSMMGMAFGSPRVPNAPIAPA